VIQVTFAKSPYDRKNQWTFKRVLDDTTPEMKALEDRVRRQIEEKHRAELEALKIESEEKQRAMEDAVHGAKEAETKAFNELAEERHKAESDKEAMDRLRKDWDAEMKTIKEVTIALEERTRMSEEAERKTLDELTEERRKAELEMERIMKHYEEELSSIKEMTQRAEGAERKAQGELAEERQKAALQAERMDKEKRAYETQLRAAKQEVIDGKQRAEEAERKALEELRKEGHKTKLETERAEEQRRDYEAQLRAMKAQLATIESTRRTEEVERKRLVDEKSKAELETKKALEASELATKSLRDEMEYRVLENRQMAEEVERMAEQLRKVKLQEECNEKKHQAEVKVMWKAMNEEQRRALLVLEAMRALERHYRAPLDMEDALARCVSASNSDIGLGSIAEGIEECVNFIKVLGLARCDCRTHLNKYPSLTMILSSDHYTVVSFIQAVQTQCRAYCQAIDHSINTVNDGCAFSTEAIDLCGYLLSKDASPDELVDYIQGMRETTISSHRAATQVSSNFRSIRNDLCEV
jgi:hypothetical protein